MDTTITTVLLVACFLGLALWDVYVAFGNRTANSKDTISGQLRHAGLQVRGLPFAFGVLGGHFFVPGHELLHKPWSILVLASVALAVSLPRWLKVERLVIPMPAALLAGIVAGWALWPQH